MDIPLPPEPVDPVAQATQDRTRLRRAFLLSAGFVALLWWLQMLQQMLAIDLRGIALRPGEWSGLIGVLGAPLLHGSLAHLVSNTLPLLLLGTLALATLPRATPRAVLLIWLLSGLGTWLIGRPSVHLGASGLGHGLMFFVLLAGLIRRDRASIATAFIAFFFYGGMLMTVFPREAGVSWEYHLCGAIAGLLAAALWSRRDPLPARKRYSWDDEAEPTPDHEYELPSPQDVPVLWQRRSIEPTSHDNVVVPFRRPPDRD